MYFCSGFIRETYSFKVVSFFSAEEVNSTKSFNSFLFRAVVVYMPYFSCRPKAFQNCSYFSRSLFSMD